MPAELKDSLQKSLPCGVLGWEGGEVLTLTHQFSVRGGVTLLWLLGQLADFMGSCAEVEDALNSAWLLSKRSEKRNRKKPGSLLKAGVQSFRKVK